MTPVSSASHLVNWLLEGDVAMQYQVHRDLLDEERPDLRARNAVEGWGAQFLAERQPDGHWGRGCVYIGRQIPGTAAAHDTAGSAGPSFDIATVRRNCSGPVRCSARGVVRYLGAGHARGKVVITVAQG